MQEISKREPNEIPNDKGKSASSGDAGSQAKDKCLTEAQSLQQTPPDKREPLAIPPEPNWLDLTNVFSQSTTPEAAKTESLKKGGLL